MPDRDDPHEADDAEAGTDEADATVPSDGGGGNAADVDEAIEALVRAYALKDETRTGWQLRGVEVI